MHLAATDESTIGALQASLETRIPDRRTMTLASAAQAWTDAVHERLGEHLALVRAFAILPFRALPPTERAFAERVAARTDQALGDDAPILTLLGTRGREPAWNDRSRSASHLATPLSARTFVDGSPMFATLLEELGARVEPSASGPASIVETDRLVTAESTFFVIDAATTVDEHGRRCIPHRAFVAEHDVRTVFGIGGSFGSGAIFTMILFARQHVTRGVAEAFVPLAGHFKGLTSAAFARGALFAPA